MVYLILSVICSSLVSIVMRSSEERAKNNISLLVVNYFVCFILACIHTGVDKLFITDEGAGTALALGMINGFFYVSGFLLLQYNIKRNGVVLSSVFMKLGVLVPTIISVLVFGEMPDAMQMIGLAIAIAAIIMVNFEKGKTGNASFKLGLIVLLLGNGCADGMSKVYREVGNAAFEEQFLLFTFVAALILSSGLMIYKKQTFTKHEVLYGILLGVPNYYSARFLLKALGDIPAVVAYPTCSVATIAVVSIAGVFLFKEKFTKKQILAIIIITISLALLN